jgi:hypothetical protein
MLLSLWDTFAPIDDMVVDTGGMDHDNDVFIHYSTTICFSINIFIFILSRVKPFHKSMIVLRECRGIFWTWVPSMTEINDVPLSV